MNKEEIVNQIREAQSLLNQLEDILVSIDVDLEYMQSDTNLKDIKEGLLSSAKSYDWDIDCLDISYHDEPEKRKILFNGIKHGYSSAIFWMADYFDLVYFFENEIGHGFENLSKEQRSDNE